jgi:3-phosphoshikimate 1-carboxyvinyltransferase
MMVGIDHERATLNERIERRVRQMWAEGFVDEVKGLKAKGYSEALQSMGALGYRLALSYLEGALSREEAITKMIHATRQYARRQRRYFDRQLPTSWYAPEGLSDPLSDNTQALISEAHAFFEAHEPFTLPSPTSSPFEVRLWGDKSIAHRAFMLSALLGTQAHPTHSVVSNIGEGADIASTREALKALGVSISAESSGEAWRVTGRGFRALKAPKAPINCGNSGTTIRLLSGLLSGLPERVTLDGDESLRRRPMKRLERALAPLGRGLEVGPLGGAPVSVGAPLNTPLPPQERVQIDTALASAQVKSAALLAALSSEAPCIEVRERALSRDHSERMLSALGFSLERDTHDPLSVRLWPQGKTQVLSQEEFHEFKVPGDPSSAAFWVAVSALSPLHAPPVLLQSCLINPTRTGFFKVARRMGVELELRVSGERLGEPVADVCVWGAPQGLKGVEVSAEEALDCLDELPLVALLGALAQGHTRVVGASELRVKESDRVEAMASLLNALGARVIATPDGWEIEGVDSLQGGEVSSADDHRVALCGVIAQLATHGEVRVLGAESATVSYPEFYEALHAFKARF